MLSNVSEWAVRTYGYLDSPRTMRRQLTTSQPIPLATLWPQRHGQQFCKRSGRRPDRSWGFTTKWTLWNCQSLAVWHRCWLENCCATVAERFPEACCPWRAPVGSNWSTSILRISRWRKHCCGSTAAKASCNWRCFCFVVCWRWQGGHMGLSQRRTLAATPPECKIGSAMFRSFVAHTVLLLQSWQIERWWHGAIKTMVVTAPASKISSRMFSGSVARPVLLLPFWHMEGSWHGAMKSLVVTAPESKISWGMCRSVAQTLLSPQFWQMEQWWPGAMHCMVVTTPGSKISWGMCGRFVAHNMLLLQLWQMEP